jgi:hypothetical protein
MLALVEVISLLLGLAGFGLAPNPNAATSAQALHYAIPDADVVVHVDLASIVPGNFKTLLALPGQPHIKSSPELLKVVRKVVAEADGARTVARATTGIDLASDLTDATVFLQLVPGKDPLFVIAVRGKQLVPAVVDKIAALASAPVHAVGGGRMVEPGKNEPAIGITRDGVLLAGTPRLVRDRLADAWKAPSRAAGTHLGHAAAAIDGRPVIAWSVTLSAPARRDLVGKLGARSFLGDLVSRHKMFAGSVFHDGLAWSWVDTSRAGLDQIATVSEGFVDLLRASHVAPRAVAKIVLGAIESYRGTNRQVDEIIQRKGDLMKVVESYTGDGAFKVAVTKDAARLRLDVRATGKTVSEVVPAGLVGPAAVLFLLGARGAVAPPPPPLPGP